MAKFEVRVDGIEELRAKLKALGKTISDALEEAVFDGSLVVVEAAQENAVRGGDSYPNRVTGNLFRSIPNVSPAVISKTPTRVEMAVGSSAEYARRLELGFVGRDSRGRYYHQGPRSFLRPALDENEKQVEDRIRERLSKIIGGR